MPTNDPVITFDRVAAISPLLVDNNGIQINWDTAVSDLQANCLWEDLQNALPFGSFLIFSDGKAEFTPTAPGIFTIKCVVTYREPISRLTNIINGLLVITVPTNFTSAVTIQYTPFKVNISTNPNNRLSTDGMGALYVPEVTEDLAALYSQARQ
jgi:hypothetical protein